MKQVSLYQGDNMISLKKLEDNSVDSVVTDGPYGLSFMNKKWDYDVPSTDFWKEVLRVLKPGGHVLSFGGTRTYHRMVVNMEDAGFEIRDQIMWIYGSGFPKSLNIGKAFDKKQGNEREVVGDNPNHRTTTGLLELGFQDGKQNSPITKGSSQYEGWGTALKPANEPICLARKPLSEKTIVDNVIKWGTGGINVDGCRIGTETISTHNAPKGTFAGGELERGSDTNSYTEHEGRFPANIIFDESAAEMLDEQTGILESGKMFAGQKTKGYEGPCMGKFPPSKTQSDTYGDKGGASRFFYVAKVSKKERNLGLDNFEDKDSKKIAFPEKDFIGSDGSVRSNEHTLTKNNHPTLKPINLMTYLCRLITPPGGIILDPFMGSGSTGISACLEGFRFVGMELDEDYFKIAEARINSYEEYRKLLK